MSIYAYLCRSAMFPLKTPIRTLDYDAVFKGEASPPPDKEQSSTYLPGLRPIEYDVDAYFKDVFAGPVF